MDPLYQALSYYRRRKFEKCVDKCSEILKYNALDQAAWTLKMKALTESVYIDDLENEEESIADEFLDENVVAETAKPGTSLRNVKPDTSSRPKTDVGHVVTGVVRSNLRSARTKTMEQSLKSARRAGSSRPLTTQSGRCVRLGTTSMITENHELFIDIRRMNLAKYATEISGKHLFEYLYYHDRDIQHAMQLSIEATKAYEFKDWWWNLQLGKCYYLLNMLRESEQNFRLALRQHASIEVFLRLIQIYKKLDQPLTALEVCKRASVVFPSEISFMVESARLHEALSNIAVSVACYRNVISKDASNVEAIACIGLHHFYTDQPEIALRFYKRLLQMGFFNAEVMNNLGLCCFYSQQYDIALSCFKRALALADKEVAANIWYNLSHVAIGVGDVNLAKNCLRLCLSFNGNHASAFNNFGVLEARRNRTTQAKSFFLTSMRHAPLLFEPHYNYAKLTYQSGDLQTSYRIIHKALELSPNHLHSTQLFNKLKQHFLQIQ